MAWKQTDLMWDDNQAVWLDSSTEHKRNLADLASTLAKSPQILAIATAIRGQAKTCICGFSLVVSHTSRVYRTARLTTFDNSPEIVESIAQWWHRNELPLRCGSRAEIVRKPNSYMQTYFRWRGIPEGNGSFINLRFQMKRLW